MRRLLSICLFAAILLPLLAPLLSLGATAETTLPACCRRGGKHHCMMATMAATKPADGQKRFQVPREICPYQQRALAVAHHEISVAAVPVDTALIRLHPLATPAQAECLRRISFDRSRQKRGPPVDLS
jgi:hypothetical protein